MSLLLLVSLSLVNLMIVGGGFIDPTDKPDHYREKVLGDSIPLVAEVKVLITPHAAAASAAVIVTDIPGDQAYMAVKHVLQESMGVADEERAMWAATSMGRGKSSCGVIGRYWEGSFQNYEPLVSASMTCESVSL